MSNSLGKSIGSLVSRINAAHEAFEKGMRTAIPHAVKAGELLIRAKKTVAHGEWLEWLRANFRGSVRTAQVYMAVAQEGREIEANANVPALLGMTLPDGEQARGVDRRDVPLVPAARRCQPLAARPRTPRTNGTRQIERRQRVRELAAAARSPAGGDAWRLVAGDCREVLAAEPEASADLVFADPPFNIGFNYRLYKDDLPDAEYLAFSREWMKQVLRVLKPGGSFYLAIGDGYAADLCCIARRELGLTLRNWIIWHYTFGQQRQSKWVSSHTHILYFSNGPEPVTFNADAVLVASARQTTYFDRRASPEGKMPDDVWVLRPKHVAGCFPEEADVWKIPRVNGTFKEREGWHPCQMPQAVLDRIMAASSNAGDLIIDPFNGSGTTGKSALRAGRRYLGIDIDAGYVANSELSLKALSVELARKAEA